MSTATSTSTRKTYGLQRVCRVWRLLRSTVYEQRRRDVIPPDQRPTPRQRGPVGACTDEELVEHIRRVLRESPFHGEGYRKVWAKLRFEGVRTSQERVCRLMKQHGLQAPRRVGHPHGPKAHDGTIITDHPDEMWGTDLTGTVTIDEGHAAVFVAVDHCTCDPGNASGSTRPQTPTVLKPWNRSARACVNTSGDSLKASPTAWPSDTITAANTCPTTSRAS